jgi:hypothetical protein
MNSSEEPFMLRQTTETVLKHAGLLIGTVYLAGFLVVAAYLSQYGTSSFSVLQLQYLVAGVWVLGPPTVAYLLKHTADEFEQRAAPAVSGRFNWRRFVISSVFTSIPAVIWVSFVAVIPGILENITWGMGVRLYLFFFAILGSGQILWASTQIQTEKENWLINRRHAAPFYLGLFLSVTLAYVVWFAVRIYPLIPFSLGGGKPLTVAFIEGEKALPEGLRSSAILKRSIPYKLLISTDRYYVVLSSDPSEKSIEISRESVAGIVVLDDSHAP